MSAKGGCSPRSKRIEASVARPILLDPRRMVTGSKVATSIIISVVKSVTPLGSDPINPARAIGPLPSAITATSGFNA